MGEARKKGRLKALRKGSGEVDDVVGGRKRVKRGRKGGRRFGKSTLKRSG